MIKSIIEKYIVPSDKFIYGFANLKGLLNEEFAEYPYGISIAEKLDDKIIDSIKDGPTLEYLNHYKEVNNDLNEISCKICKELEAIGIKSLRIASTSSMTSDEFKPYRKALRYKVSHKMIATRAGLGWIGKTDLLITKEFGPRVRLVSILIDKQVDFINQSIDKSKCGKCNICVEKCPAKAATGLLWDINTDRDIFFDAHKCEQNCLDVTKSRLGFETRICGICVSVCPVGRML
jgi:epoxyqueuosine reductase QueG